LVETPWIGKIAGWSIILTTVGAGFTALGAYIGYVGMQLAGLAASFATFFHMRNRENRQMLEAETRAKVMSERLAQARARMLLEELPLQKARLELLIAQTEQEAALAEVSKARLRGAGLATAEANLRIANERVKRYQTLTNQLKDISQLRALELERDKLRAANLNHEIAVARGHLRLQEEFVELTDKGTQVHKEATERAAKLRQHYEGLVKMRQRLYELERRISNIKKIDLSKIEQELGLRQTQISRTQRLLALEKERVRTLREAFGYVQPRIAPTMLTGVPAAWGRIGRVHLTGTAATLMTPEIRRRFIASAWREIGSTLIAPLRAAQGAIIGFTGALKRGTLALWGAIRPMISGFATMVIQMGVWTAAFAALGFVFQLLADNANKASRALEEATALLGKQLQFLREQKLINIPQWQLEAAESARRAAEGFEEIERKRKWWIFPRPGAITVREMLKLGGIPETEIGALRRRIRDELRYQQEYLKAPLRSPAEALQKSMIAGTVKELERLTESQDIYNERLSTSLAIMLARAMAAEKNQRAHKLQKEELKEIAKLDEKARDLAKERVFLSEEQAQTVMEAMRPATILSEIYKEQIDRQNESIESQKEAREQFDKAAKEGRSFIAAYRAYSEDLEADEKALKNNVDLIERMKEIAPAMAADLEKQTDEKRKQLELRKIELDVLESIYWLEKMRLVMPVYEAAKGPPLPTLTVAQIQQRRYLIAEEMARSEEVRDLSKVYKWQKEILELRERQIAADRELREQAINNLNDELAKEEQLVELVEDDMQQRRQLYELQRRLIWAMPLSRVERLQALAELYERYDKEMLLLEKQQYDHIVKVQTLQYQNLKKQYEIQRTIAEARGASAADLLIYDIAIARVEEQIARLNNDSLEAETKRAEQLGLMADREREWQEQRTKWYNDWLSLRDQELDIAQKLFNMGLIGEQQVAAVRQRNALIVLNNLNRLRRGTKEWNEEYLKYLDLIKQGQDETSDRFQNLIEQIIGAPQEAIQRFLSPAAIQQRFGQLAPAVAGLMGGIEAQLAGVRGKEIFIRVRIEGLEAGQIDNRILKVVEPELRDFAHRLTNALGR